MKKFSIVCGLILASTLIPVKVLAASFSQIFVYGDSLSDLGRAYALTGNAAPPYGGFTGGRFSNGPVWVEYLATSLGLTSTLANRNNNFAVGGATTGTVNTIPGLSGGIQNQIAATTNNPADPNALYVIWGGANDYLGGGQQNPTVPVTNLSSEISTLITLGARNILVPNLPDLGALPGTRGTPNATGLTTLTQLHNTGLASIINGFSQTNPGVKLLDVNSLFAQAVASPGSFGFTNVTDACVQPTGICTNPNEYLFWDPIHPTTVGHQQIANLAVSTLVPEPMTIAGTIVAGGAVIAFRRKLKSRVLKK